MTLTVLATSEFRSPINSETSAGSERLGNHASTMTLYADDGFMIEWDIPTLGETVQIGLWFEGKNLSDYDGVFELPKQAVALIRRAGFTVGREFAARD